MTFPDYLAIGHVSRDHTPSGKRLGGSVAYAARTAAALGLRPAVLTSCEDNTDLNALSGLPLQRVPSAATTTFALEETNAGRRLRLLARAAFLSAEAIPSAWRRPAIVHLAPVADEVAPAVASRFAGRFVGVTPQGWMRTWDAAGWVHPKPWDKAEAVLPWVSAVVVSEEDLGGDHAPAQAWAQRVPVVVTQGAAGAILYWGDLRRHAPAPPVAAADTTGAGDIFAAAFFVRLYHTGDPWAALRFAVAVASLSVQRVGLASTPTPQEIRRLMDA